MVRGAPIEIRDKGRAVSYIVWLLVASSHKGILFRWPINAIIISLSMKFRQIRTKANLPQHNYMLMADYLLPAAQTTDIE